MLTILSGKANVTSKFNNGPKLGMYYKHYECDEEVQIDKNDKYKLCLKFFKDIKNAEKIR